MKLHNRTDTIWHTFLLPLSLTSVPFTLMRDQTKVCFYKVTKISFRIFQNSLFTSKTSNIIFVKDHSYIVYLSKNGHSLNPPSHTAYVVYKWSTSLSIFFATFIWYFLVWFADMFYLLLTPYHYGLITISMRGSLWNVRPQCTMPYLID